MGDEARTRDQDSQTEEGLLGMHGYFLLSL
jgi:hypothetical protein